MIHSRSRVGRSQTLACQGKTATAHDAVGATVEQLLRAVVRRVILWCAVLAGCGRRHRRHLRHALVVYRARVAAT